MTNKVTAVILRPREDDVELHTQAASLTREAWRLMNQVATVDLDSVKLARASDTVTVNLGTPTEPYMVSAWQQKLVGALFEAEGTAGTFHHQSGVSIDPEVRKYHLVAVEGLT